MSAPPAVIIAGCPGQAEVASHLLFMTMRPLAPYWLGLNGERAAHDVLAGLYRRPGNLFSYEFAEMAVVDQKVVGLMIAYPSRTMNRLEVPSLMQFIHVAGIWNAARLVSRSWPLQGIASAAPHEYFLAHLAVLPKYQGRGIGRMLLQLSEERAQQSHARGLTLTVEVENKRAIELYTRAGLMITSTVKFGSLRKRFGYLGFHYMSKDLLT